MLPIGRDRVFMIFIALLLLVDIVIRYKEPSMQNVISSSRSTVSRAELERELELDITGDEGGTPDRDDAEDTSKPNESSTSTTSTTTEAELAARTCTTDENIFFLKTSKTGSQTLMAIMQRFGIRHNSTFFIGESKNGAMSQIHVPISGEKDCWIGKHLNMKFNISTQHLKYDKNLIDSVMHPGYKRISIIREPTSNFISSYRYYQYLMTPIWLPMGFRAEKKNPPTDVLYKKMETMLASTETAHQIINQINPAAFARLGTYRSELLYFGYFIDETGHEWHSGFRLPCVHCTWTGNDKNIATTHDRCDRTRVQELQKN